MGNMIDLETNTLLQLIRAAMGHGTALVHDDVDWEAIIRLANSQHLTAVVHDGVLTSDISVNDAEIAARWAGEVWLVEQNYRRHLKEISTLASLLSSKGLSLTLLKGVGVGLNYPVPQHRGVGDIDFYVWRDPDHRCCLEESNTAISQMLHIEADHSHAHHTTFTHNGILLENHYEFIGVNDLRSSRWIEAELKLLMQQGVMRRADIFSDAIVWLPPVDFDIAFLSRHSARHFSGSGINLRQLLDWALFVKSHHEEVDWESTIDRWERIGMTTFMGCVNSICVNWLGFGEDLFHGVVSADDYLTQRVLLDAVHPAFADTAPRSGSMGFRLRRFAHNGWKRRITYHEGTLEAFFSIAMGKVRWRI